MTAAEPASQAVASHFFTVRRLRPGAAVGRRRGGDLTSVAALEPALPLLLLWRGASELGSACCGCSRRCRGSSWERARGCSPRCCSTWARLPLGRPLRALEHAVRGLARELARRRLRRRPRPLGPGGFRRRTRGRRPRGRGVELLESARLRARAPAAARATPAPLRADRGAPPVARRSAAARAARARSVELWPNGGRFWHATAPPASAARARWAEASAGAGRAEPAAAPDGRGRAAGLPRRRPRRAGGSGPDSCPCRSRARAWAHRVATTRRSRSSLRRAEAALPRGREARARRGLRRARREPGRNFATLSGVEVLRLDAAAPELVARHPDHRALVSGVRPAD